MNGQVFGALYVFALAGLVVSAGVHSATYFGGGGLPAALLVLMHLGVFVPFGAGILGLGVGGGGWGGAGARGAASDAWRVVARHTPAWVFLVEVALGFYAFANFFLCLSLMEHASPHAEDGRYYLRDHGRIVRELSAEEFGRIRGYETRLMSADWLVFYAAGATMTRALSREGAVEEPPAGAPGSVMALEGRMPAAWPLQRILMIPGVIANLFFVWFVYQWMGMRFGEERFVFLGFVGLITLINVGRLIFWRQKKPAP